MSESEEKVAAVLEALELWCDEQNMTSACKSLTLATYGVPIWTEGGVRYVAAVLDALHASEVRILLCAVSPVGDEEDAQRISHEELGRPVALGTQLRMAKPGSPADEAKCLLELADGPATPEEVEECIALVDEAMRASEESPSGEDTPDPSLN